MDYRQWCERYRDHPLLRQISDKLIWQLQAGESTYSVMPMAGQLYDQAGEVIRQCAPNAKDFTHRRCRYKDQVDEKELAKNRTKSSIRAKVKHPFLIIKRIFGFTTTRYKGLEKNAHRLFVTCALASLYMVRRQLLRLAQA